MKMQRKILNLIIKDLTDEIGPSEEKELKAWIKARPENEQQFIQIEQLLRLTDSSFETYTPKTEEQWEKLRSRIEAEIVQPKVIPFSMGRWWKIAATLLLLVGIGFLLRTTLEKDESNVLVEIAINNEVDKKDLTAEVFTKDSIRIFYLSDSSKIRLNTNSKFIYPEEFAGANRVVTLIGEAFFEVTSDPSKPFIVLAGNTETRVLGTSFNVKAYEDDHEVEVIVVAGKVELSSKGGQDENTVILKANDRGTFNKGESTIKKEKIKGKKFKWWFKNIEKDIKRIVNKAKKKLHINKNK